eukprot:3179575-Pleurochrysis_carterae.AAC.1
MSHFLGSKIVLGRSQQCLEGRDTEYVQKYHSNVAVSPRLRSCAAAEGRNTEHVQKYRSNTAVSPRL